MFRPTRPQREHIEERGGLLPILGLTICPAAIDGDPEVVGRLATGGERSLDPEFRFPTTYIVSIGHLPYAPFALGLRRMVACRRNQGAPPASHLVRQPDDLVTDHLVSARWSIRSSQPWPPARPSPR